jgi:hypothetical protein
MNLLIGIICGIIAQVWVFFQLQGPLKYEWLRDHTWFVMLWGIPISYLFTLSVRYYVTEFNGEIWPSRLIGFGIGTIVFIIMSYIIFNEPFTLKTGICLVLSLLIIAIQLFWK